MNSAFLKTNTHGITHLKPHMQERVSKAKVDYRKTGIHECLNNDSPVNYLLYSRSVIIPPLGLRIVQ